MIDLRRKTEDQTKTIHELKEMIANMEADGRVTAANNQGEITNTNTACVSYSRVLVRGSVANKYRIT